MTVAWSELSLPPAPSDVGLALLGQRGLQLSFDSGWQAWAFPRKPQASAPGLRPGGASSSSDVQTALISSRRRSSVNHHCSSAAMSASCAAASDAVPVTNRDPGRNAAVEEIAVVAHHSTVPSYAETRFCSRSRIGRLVEYQQNEDHPRERAMLRAGHLSAEGVHA